MVRRAVRGNRNFGFTLQIFAGTVISTNLPLNTFIANIDARADGAAGFDGGQYHWFRPFYTGGATNYVSCTLPAGTYGFRVINAADALAMFPALTSDQTNEMFSAWTYNSPYITDYMVFDFAATTNGAIPQLFEGSPDPTSFGDPAASYAHAVSAGWANKLRTSSLGRAATNYVTSYTFTHTATIVFIAPDYDLNDNHGGVSVLVSPLPVLSTATNTTSATLAWLTNFSAFNLESSTNLVDKTWTIIPPQSLATNGNFISISVPDQTGSKFYRLHQVNP